MPTLAGKTFVGSATLAKTYARAYPLSVKLSLMRKLCAHIEGITRAAGYQFDLHPQPDEHGVVVPRVYRGRAVFGDNDPVPLISVLEGPVPDRDPRFAALNQVKREDDWIIFVQGWAATPQQNPTDPAYQLMAAVERRLSEIVSSRLSGLPLNPAAYMLGGAISGFSIGPGVVRPPQDGVSSKAFFYLPCVIRLPVDVTQPFVTA